MTGATGDERPSGRGDQDALRYRCRRAIFAELDRYAELNKPAGFIREELLDQAVIAQVQKETETLAVLSDKERSQLNQLLKKVLMSLESAAVAD